MLLDIRCSAQSLGQTLQKAPQPGASQHPDANTHSAKRWVTTWWGIRRFWAIEAASQTTASRMAPSWKRRSSERNPQNWRKSAA